MPDVKNSGYVFDAGTKKWSFSAPASIEPGVGHANAPPLPKNDPEKVAREKVDKLWATQARLSNFGTIYNAVESQFPTFTHSIAVSVTGGPKSDMRRIWLLCLATAFGRYRQGARTGIQTGQLQATWDITGKSCQVVISYVNSGIEGVLSGIKGGPLSSAVDVPIPGAQFAKFYAAALESPTVGDFLFAGPSQETVGGDTLSWLNADGVVAAVTIGAIAGAGVGYVVGGLANKISGGLSSQVGLTPSKYAQFGAITGAVLSNVVAQAKEKLSKRPALPDTNRLITTANKLDPNVQPPAPSGDGVSRTFPWVALVSNALTSPCYLPTFPPPGAQLDTRTPVYYNSPPQTTTLNNTVPNYISNQPINTDANVEAVLQTLDDLSQRKDGYSTSLSTDAPTLNGRPNPGTQ